MFSYLIINTDFLFFLMTFILASPLILIYYWILKDYF